MLDNAPFTNLLAKIATTLKQRGFQRKGNSFWSSTAGNWAIIQLQRSTKSSAAATTFTLNLGTASKALLGFFGKAARVPKIEECHWRQRIGFTLPVATDRWWQLTSADEVGTVADEVNDALVDFGLPAIKSHLSDTSMRELWLSGCAPGLTETDRLKFLSALLNIQGLDAESVTIAARLRAESIGKPTAGLASMHVRKLASENRGG